jgi:hypothetical protein
MTASRDDTALQSFVTGLRADQGCRHRRVHPRSSSGSVEGHINRIDVLKPKM